jgi:hypothetical protein
MKTLFLFLLAGFSTVSFADMSGYWSADRGSLIDPTGRKSACAKIEITIQQEPGKLIIERYHAQCTLLDSDWGPYRMTVQGETVLNFEGEEIGTLKGDTLLTQFEGYTINMQLNGDALKSLYAASGLIGSMIIEGELRRTP